MAELPSKLVIGIQEWLTMPRHERQIWEEELACRGVHTMDQVKEIIVERVSEKEARATVVGYCQGPFSDYGGGLSTGMHIRAWCLGPGRDSGRRIAAAEQLWKPGVIHETFYSSPEIYSTYVWADSRDPCILITHVFYLHLDRILSLFPPQPLWSPDPVVGWRTWQFAWRGGRIVLQGVMRPWEAGQVNVAFHLPDGRQEQQHSAPGWNCRCGFNAFKTLRSLLRYGSYDMDVAGRVELFGNVVEHERGYRAEKARILDLVFPRRVPKYSQLVPDFFTGMNAHNIPTFNNWSDYLDYLSTQSNAAHDDLVHSPRAEIANFASSFLAPRKSWARGLTAIR